MDQSRVTLFVPGVTESSWGEAAVPDDVELEWIDNDGRFGEAFGFGTVGDALLAAIDASAGAVVAYVGVDLREGRGAVVALVARLRAAGGLAVRVEESGLGWEIGRWLAAYRSDDAWAWHQHAVVFVSDDDGAIQSCGMHAFSLPEVRLDAGPDVQRIGEVLNIYQLDEDPVLRSGETFTPDAETPRRPLQRWPDAMHASGDVFHNPYGVWHLGAAGAPGEGTSELHMTFVPPLVAVLTATEQQHGAPLDEAQVLTVRDAATCIAMEPRHARDLERTRGYADIDPELAWEQWQLVRDL